MATDSATVPPVIDDFDGPHRFLSNFFSAPIVVNGIRYPTNEHAFASFKTTDIAMRQRIAKLFTPGQAKRLGRELPLRTDWGKIKIAVMTRLVRAKFTQHPQLARLLCATAPAQLVEGNTWGDRVWGVDRNSGIGDNRLGRILMQHRDALLAMASSAAAPVVIEPQRCDEYEYLICVASQLAIDDPDLAASIEHCAENVLAMHREIQQLRSTASQTPLAGQRARAAGAK